MLGRNRDLHQYRARMAWPLLVAKATEGGQSFQNDQWPVFTYKELGDLIGVHHRVVGYALGEIQAYCHNMDIPPLQALVVSATGKEKGLPGRGYHGSPRNIKEHRAALKKVYLHGWSNNPPSFKQ